MGQIKIDASNLADSLLLGFVAPRITSIVYPSGTATDPAGGETVTIKGTGFQYGATARIAGVAVGVTTVVDFNTITFTAPAKTAGNYALTVLNPDGGLGTSTSDLVYSGAPTWSTAAGSIGSAYETSSLSTSLSANSDSAVTFSLSSGTLPGGTTLASNGLLSGTLSNVNNATTYNFTIAATDAESQSNTRSFSYVTNPDVVTFSTSNNITISTMATSAMSTNTMVATSAAGKTITYSVNSLPTGISINATSGAITGTPTTTGNSVTLVTATAANTNKSASISVNFAITPFVAQSVTANMLLVAGGGGGGRDGGYNVCGGGGGAGGYRLATITLWASNTYTVTIGAGGSVNTNGSNSSLVSVAADLNQLAQGGGFGGYVGATAGSGGSGGGAGSRANITFGNSGLPGSATGVGTGNNGGSWQFLISMISNPTWPASGGGGGGGGAGGTGTATGNSSGFNGARSGNGGAGITSNISGTDVGYAGGGAGGNDYSGQGSYVGVGTHGGGSGAGFTSSVNAGDRGWGDFTSTAGEANKGGGGGGSGNRLSGFAGANTGGSGVLIVSYPGSAIFTGGTITTVGSNTVHTFTSSGSLVPV